MDKIAKVKNNLQLQQWAQIVTERQNTGMTVAQWHEHEQISKSVYYCGEQMCLFNEAEIESRHKEDDSVTVPAHKRKKRRSRAKIIGDLPIEEVIHEVEDKTCELCGSKMKPVGKEFAHDELVYVPAKLFVRKHYVEVVKCVSSDTDESRDAEQPDDIEKERFRKGTAPSLLIPHSFCSPELLAHIIYEKYCNAMPLYRQEQDFKAHGVELSRTTMANWIIRIAEEKAKPVFDAMKAELLLAGSVIHADEKPYRYFTRRVVRQRPSRVCGYTAMQRLTANTLRSTTIARPEPARMLLILWVPLVAVLYVMATTATTS